jgi:chromosome segregation ATPase
MSVFYIYSLEIY